MTDSTREFVDKVHDNQEKQRKNKEHHGQNVQSKQLPNKQHSTNK
nr:DUF4023 domain-containing protein [Paenibacillus dokdonensis]